jgi:hypothetical protein
VQHSEVPLGIVDRTDYAARVYSSLAADAGSIHAPSFSCRDAKRPELCRIMQRPDLNSLQNCESYTRFRERCSHQLKPNDKIVTE